MTTTREGEGFKRNPDFDTAHPEKLLAFLQTEFAADQETIHYLQAYLVQARIKGMAELSALDRDLRTQIDSHLNYLRLINSAEVDSHSPKTKFEHERERIGTEIQMAARQFRILQLVEELLRRDKLDLGNRLVKDLTGINLRGAPRLRSDQIQAIFEGLLAFTANKSRTKWAFSTTKLSGHSLCRYLKEEGWIDKDLSEDGVRDRVLKSIERARSEHGIAFPITPATNVQFYFSNREHIRQALQSLKGSRNDLTAL